MEHTVIHDEKVDRTQGFAISEKKDILHTIVPHG